MREKPEEIVKYICIGLGVLLFIQFIRIVVTANPLAHVVVPALPSLPDDSVATNQTTVASSTVAPQLHTNRVPVGAAASTNLSLSKTNIASLTEPKTNSGPVTGMNIIAVHSGHRHRHGNPFAGNMGGMVGMGGMPAMKQTTVTPAIQASIDRIINSEILGPIMHPMPMALLGIAGNVAFLRSPDGQTGLVKEGDALGTIKLIKIGTNRVLVEEGGQQKELTIFDGMGGQTLLDKPSESPNENTNP